MRKKFTAQLACNCTDEMKREVEREAASDGLSIADVTRLAVARWLRARKQEASHAA